MYITTIFILTTLIPIVQLASPTIKLTLSPEHKYYSHRDEVEIKCEVLNPTERNEIVQLWYVDLKSNKRTPISRSLLTTPLDDAPEVFRKYNRNRRYVFERKNHIRIKSLQMEDSAKYECDCPDCEENLPKQVQNLHVMKLNTPKWVIEPGWPLHENTKATIKCQVDDFYPYVGTKILRNHLEITNDGKSSLSNKDAFPHKLTWEATITPNADWHNSLLRCIITEGNSEQQANKTLEILFAPQFIKCDDRQYVDANKNLSTIECSYKGNPQPKIQWFRGKDTKSIGFTDIGLTIDTKDEQNAKYKSILTIDRNKYLSVPDQGNISRETSYQQLLNNGFTVKLTNNGNDKGTRLITIVHDLNQIRRKDVEDNQSINNSYSLILLSFIFIFHIIQR